MTKILRLMNPLLLALSLLFALGAEARNTDSLRWAPEWGAELITEQQVTTKGRYRSATEGDAFIRKNCANLLRLQASLPIAHDFSIDVGSLSTFMTAKESIGDDIQTFSNLDAERIPFALSVCGVNWNAGDHHSLFVGIRNMNEDYFCSPVTSLFTNSSCGVYPTISTNYDIANYPFASMGGHYKYENRNIALQASLYNGKGSRRFSGSENVFRFCPKSDGLFGLAEATYTHRGSSYFVGTAVYWAGSAPPLATAPLQLPPIGGGLEASADEAEQGTRSVFYEHSPYRGELEGGRSLRGVCGPHFSPWAYAEQRITDRLSLIAGYSHAFGHDAACRDFAGLGGRYTWNRAELGLFTDYANFAEGSEWATELTCKIDLVRHLYLQPSLHAIFMPEASNLFQGAGTLRLGVTF